MQDCDCKTAQGCKRENYRIIHKLEMGNFHFIMAKPKTIKHASIIASRKHMTQEVDIDLEKERDRGSLVSSHTAIQN